MPPAGNTFFVEMGKNKKKKKKQQKKTITQMRTSALLQGEAQGPSAGGMIRLYEAANT